MLFKPSHMTLLIAQYLLASTVQADCTVSPVPIGHIETITCQDATTFIPAPGIIGYMGQSAIIIKDNPATPGSDMNVWHNSGFTQVWGDTTHAAGYDVQTANSLNYQTTTPMAFTVTDAGNGQSTGVKLKAGRNIHAKIDSIVSNNNRIGLQALSDSGAVNLTFNQVMLNNHAAGLQASTHNNDLSLIIHKDTSKIQVDDGGIGIDVNVTGEGQNKKITVDSAAQVTNAAIGIRAAANGNDIEVTNRNTLYAHQIGISAQTGSGEIGIYNHGNVTGNNTAAIWIKANGSKQVLVGSYAGTLTGQTGIQATNAAGKVIIDNRSAINPATHGIVAQTSTGDIAVYNKNKVNAHSGTGIVMKGAGAIYLENTADIIGKGYAAIHATNTGSKATHLISTGAKLIGKLGIALKAGAGTSRIQNRSVIDATETGIRVETMDGEMTIQNYSTIKVKLNGIQTISGSGKTTLYTEGVIESSAGDGIHALSESDDHELILNIQNNILAKGTANSTAITIDSSGSGSIGIGNNTTLDASRGIDLNLKPREQLESYFEILNAGTIDTLTDQAILSTGAGSIQLTNDGTLFGNVAVEATTTFVNNGQWSLRKLTGSTDFKDRNTKSIAISRFGTDSTLQNHGLIQFDNVSTTLFDAQDSYVPAGALAQEDGVEHGYLLNLSRFENHPSGIIDLTTNNQAGDVLVISGSTTAGTHGNGEFITHGGAIKLDTLLNAGDTQSLSDMLVLDNVTYGTNSTRIFITPMSSSTSGDTVNDGIKIIEVLGTSDNNVFELGAPVTHGLYEYRLSQGKSSQNWYLRNHADAPDNGGDDSGEDGSNNNTGGNNNNGNNNGGNGANGANGDGNNAGEQPGAKNYFYNPNISALLGNQYAASEMFYLSKADRQNELNHHDRSLWLRTQYHQTDANLLNGKQSIDISTSVVQLGADLLKTDDFNAGVFAGIGQSRVNGKSNQTQSKAAGKVKGHQIGVYASWEDDEVLGPYLDFWAMYGWFNNRLNGASQAKETRYDSRGFALSAEGGNAFMLSQFKSGSKLLMKPNAQFSYHRQKINHFTDSHNTTYTNGISDGMKARMGVRLAYQSLYPAINPYLEFNWIMNDINHGVELNKQRVASEMGKNVTEAKIGFQGQARQNVNVWGHIAGQSGSEKFRNTQVQLGANYTF